MDYRCPLCLKQLDETDSFERFCIKHKGADTARTFQFSEVDFHRAAHCPISKCDSALEIAKGVFIRHIGCSASSPFTGDGAVNIGQDLNGGNRFLHEGRPVDHWQIGAARQLPSEYPEMWFPLALFGVGAKEPAGIKSGGVMVGLAGAKGAGKTVLAMQALDREGYINQGSTDSIRIDDFIYSQRQPGSGGQPMLETLLLRGIMKRNLGNVTLPEPTAPQVGDLKTVFFKQAVKTPEVTETVNKPVAGGGFFSRNFGQLNDLIKESINTNGGACSICDSWYAIAFYDTAGEDNEIEAARVRQVDEAVDKVAIVFDSVHLSQNDDESRRALATVIARMEALTDARTPVCLVLTKLDMILPKIGGVLGFKGMDAVLSKMVFASQDEKRSHLIDLLEDEYYEGKQQVVELIETHKPPIFYVWHENLPKMKTATHELTYLGQPVSYGLQEFICWCLGIEWDEVTQKRRR